MTDQNRKTLRSFYCIDSLWTLFEQQTHEFGVSMDYLLNESMIFYAEAQGFGASNTQDYNQDYGQGYPNGLANDSQPYLSNPPLNQTQMQQLQMQQQVAPMQPPMQSMQQPRGTQVVNTQPPGQRGYNPTQGAPQMRQPPINSPQSNMTGGFGAQYQSMQQGSHGPSEMYQQAPWGPPNARNNYAGPMHAPPQPPRTGLPNAPTLYLFFDNNRYTIGTDDFIIGRGSQHNDLTIRDGNISRQHCVIIYRNGSHYIKDLGSTNGIEFQGNRIESKKIADGDVFYLCDYELRFSYQ